MVGIEEAVQEAGEAAYDQPVTPADRKPAFYMVGTIECMRTAGGRHADGGPIFCDEPSAPRLDQANRDDVNDAASGAGRLPGT